MKQLAGRWKRGAAFAVRLPILAYRYTLSPAIGHVCRFEPTCSQYALEAIDTHGAAKGLWLTIKRLGRCHPIEWLGGSAGIDPVPPAPPATVNGD